MLRKNLVKVLLLPSSKMDSRLFLQKSNKVNKVFGLERYGSLLQFGGKVKIFSYGCHVFFDIDGTIKGSYTPEAPAGFDPKLPYLLATLNDIPGISVGVCTSQSP